MLTNKGTRKMSARRQIPARILALTLALPVSAYASPLSAEEIREAYFLGTRQGGLTPEFLKQYVHAVPELREHTCTSQLTIETPFLQVAEYASEVPNYSAQEAIRDFYGKPMVFRIHLDICYQVDAPPPNSVKIKITQNKKHVVPLSSESSPYYPPSDAGYPPANGERVQLDFNPEALDSSTVTVVIDTPNGQHSTTEFDPQAIR
jgi:hypothetical protein